MTLDLARYLVRHGRPTVDTTRPAAEWELDPADLVGVDSP